MFEEKSPIDDGFIARHSRADGKAGTLTFDGIGVHDLEGVEFRDFSVRTPLVDFLTHQPAHLQHSIAEVYALQALWNTVAFGAPRTVSWVMDGSDGNNE